LVLVFAQEIKDVIQLTWDDVTVTHELVTVRLSDLNITLPRRSTSPGANSPNNPAAT
jgi:hypothetical protein